MSLSTALQIAQSSLSSLTRQTSIAARNVSSAGNEDYSRREIELESGEYGVRVATTRRATDARLARANLTALSDSSAQRYLANRVDELNSVLNGADGSLSASALMTNLHEKLQNYSAQPSNALYGQAVVNSAKDLVTMIGGATSAVQEFRRSMDRDISAAVDDLNRLLGEFGKLNGEVVNGTFTGQDVNDALDRRDAVLRKIATYVPVSSITRAGNDMMLVTTGGATLFEKEPRSVTFTPQTVYGPSTVGLPVRVDGIPLAEGTGANTAAGGSIAAMLQLRDSTATTLQSQLDEVARGLVEAFAERGAPGSGLTPLAGLFTYSGGPGLPPAGTVVTGMAASLQVNAAYDADQGGNPALLRDGGVNGAAYVENTSGGASYTGRLIALAEGMDATMAFDAQSGVGGNFSILGFAAQAQAWLDGFRSDASHAAERKEALSAQLAEKLGNTVGVNIDDEMSRLVELEHSYQASARLLMTVDQMLKTLMAAMG